MNVGSTSRLTRGLKLFGYFVASTGALGAAAFAYRTRNSRFVHLDLNEDGIKRSIHYIKYNPRDNPTTHDLCIRQVPLEKIRPELLEKEGKLVEAFCAGIWGGPAYEPQRRYLENKYRGEWTKHQLWDSDELLRSTYDVGTQITDHFEVMSKTPTTITLRCGDSPLKYPGVRASDGLFEVSARIDKDTGAAVFGLKSVLYNGVGEEKNKPMPWYVEWAHRQYTKFWMESAIRNCLAR